MSPGLPQRIAVLLEPGARGRGALRRAVAIASELEAELTIVALVPRAQPPRCGAAHAQPYQDAVRDQVSRELGDAAAVVRRPGAEPRQVLLEEGRDIPLPRWLTEHAIGLVLLPARRSVLAPGHHPLERELRLELAARVTVVGR